MVKNIFLLCRSFIIKNTFLKNETRTQKYFSNMALKQKKVSPPLVYAYPKSQIASK
jgi:hypothetical protein